MISTKAFAALDAKTPLQPFAFTRRDPGPHDVVIEVKYCGVCHSDLHQARNEWSSSTYPMVPGHEIVGRVVQVGSAVTRFAVGSFAGVGCMVDSCRTCASCKAGNEQYCEKHVSFTYNSTEQDEKTPTQGGYSSTIVVPEAFALRIAEGLPLERVAPLLCAGITMYSPLKHWKIGHGHRVAVVGLGGLGHMAVQLAAALGADVTLVSTSEKKKADALRLGAHGFLNSKEPKALSRAKNQFDFVLDTVAAEHDLEAYLELLRTDGTLVLVGAPEQPLPVPAFALIPKRRTLAGSMIGGIAETQEMLDFCASNKIGAEVEVLPVEQINTAFDRMLANDVRYRFVLDVSSLRG